MLLTVELISGSKDGNTQDEVEIICDKEGLDLLLYKLNILLVHGGHVHLMTESWAGNELTEVKQAEDSELINHLCIRLLKPEFIKSERRITSEGN